MIDLTPADDGSDAPHNTDELIQTREFFANMDSDERTILFNNLASTLSLISITQVVTRSLNVMNYIDPAFGQGVSDALDDLRQSPTNS